MRMVACATRCVKLLTERLTELRRSAGFVVCSSTFFAPGTQTCNTLFFRKERLGACTPLEMGS